MWRNSSSVTEHLSTDIFTNRRCSIQLQKHIRFQSILGPIHLEISDVIALYCSSKPCQRFREKVKRQEYGRPPVRKTSLFSSHFYVLCHYIFPFTVLVLKLFLYFCCFFFLFSLWKSLLYRKVVCCRIILKPPKKNKIW